MSVVEQLRQLEEEAQRAAWAAYNRMIRSARPDARKLRAAGAQVGRDVAAIERDLSALASHRRITEEVATIGTFAEIEAACVAAIQRHEEALEAVEAAKRAAELAADAIRHEQDRGAKRERLEKQLAELESAHRSVFPLDDGPCLGG